MAKGRTNEEVFEDVAKLFEIADDLVGSDKDSRYHLDADEYKIASRLGTKKKALTFVDTINLIKKFFIDRIDRRYLNHPMKKALSHVMLPYTVHNRHGGPHEYIFFDFCLAAIDEDFLDARIYLELSYKLLGIHPSMYRFLLRLIDRKISGDPVIQHLLALLALSIMPASAHVSFGGLEKEYSERAQKFAKIAKEYVGFLDK